MLLLTSESFPHYGLERFFSFAKESGYDGVEIVVNSNFDTQNPGYIQKLSKEYGIKVGALSLTENKTEKYLSAFLHLVSFFPETNVNMTPPELFSFEYKRFLEEKLPKSAQKNNFLLNRRNTELKLILGFIPLQQENSLYALKKAGFVSLDLSALYRNNADPLRAVNYLGKRLRHVYLSNVFHGKSYENLMQGLIPIESLLTKLAQNDFTGDFTLKLSPRAIQEGNEDEMKRLLRENKAFFEKYFIK